MSNRTIRAAIGSTCSKPGNLEENIRQIKELAEQAQANRCHLLVTPEMSATGYGEYPEILTLAEQPGQGRIYRSLAQIANQTGVVIAAGYVEQNMDQRHIAHYAVYPDGSFVSQRKHRATPWERPIDPGVELYYDDTEEIGHVPEGKAYFQTFIVNDVRCVIVVCADMGVKNLSSILQQAGVELMALPVGAGGSREHRLSVNELKTEEGIHKYRDILGRNSFPQDGVIESLRNNRATLAVNMSGYDGKTRYHGGSGSIVSARGEVRAYIPDQFVIEYQQLSFAFAELQYD